MSARHDSIPKALVSAGQRAAPDQGYSFVDEEGAGERFVSFGQLADDAARHAAALLRLGLRPGDRVALVLPKSHDFVPLFLGALHAGIIPVPMYPPMSLGKLGTYLDHSRHIVERSEAAVLITDGSVKRALGGLIGERLQVIRTVDQLDTSGPGAPLANLRDDAPAFIQFTSGSTARPKGVVLTHGNLASNAHCIMRLGLRAGPSDKGCTWLPLFHDMGLIGFVLSPITTLTSVAFMPPLMFLKRPVEWLRLVTRHRGTIGFAPNFAYGVCAARIKDHELEGLDLSSWRVAGCGAEPIHLPTLTGFAERFERVGFRRGALMPCFGLAESTLAVSFAPLGPGPTGDTVDLGALTSDRQARPVPAGADGATSVVCCGRPFEGHEIAIVDDDGRPLPDRAVGEIVLRGPSVMQGYFHDEEATRQVLRGGALRTGDLGYTVDGALYVCGRSKDVVIVGGRNYYPSDIEWAASTVAGVRTGNVVAFGVTLPNGEAEQVVLCAETRRAPEEYHELERAVRGTVLDAIGVKLHEVVLLAPGTLPKTSSGKVRRRRTRELYLSGQLRESGRNDGRIVVAGHLLVSQWRLWRSQGRRITTGDTTGGPP